MEQSKIIDTTETYQHPFGRQGEEVQNSPRTLRIELPHPEIRNSDWGESFAQIFLVKLAFLQQKKSVNRLTGGPREPRPRPGGRVRPLSCGHPGHRFALILPPENPKYFKIILCPFLSHLDFV